MGGWPIHTRKTKQDPLCGSLPFCKCTCSRLLKYMLGMTQSYKRRTLISCSPISMGFDASVSQTKTRAAESESYQIGHDNLGASELVGGPSRGSSAVGRLGCVRGSRGVGSLSSDSGGGSLADAASRSSRGRSLRTATVLAGTGSEDLVERTIEVGRHGEGGT